MLKRAFWLPLIVVLLTCGVYARQAFPTNIQIAINQLVTGIIPFQNQVFIPAGYANWDSTKGVNGYGIRGNSGVMEFKDFGGSWTPFNSGSGSPADARYWVGVANGGLTNEIILGGLGTGIILNTTVTGVPTIYAGTSCTNQFVSALSAAGIATCASVTPTDFSGTLPVTKGGTGLTSGTSGGVLYFSAGTTLASSAALTANRLVLGGGAGAAPTVLGSLGTTTTLLHGNAAGAPTFGAVTLTTDVTGILPGANGGTNSAFFAVAGPATTLKTFTFPNASSTVLTTNTAVTPAQGGTGISSYTIGDLLYASGATTLSKLIDVATGNALISGGAATAPSWGKIGLTTHVTGTLGATNGGTGLASYVIGDLLYANSTTTLSRLAAGAESYILTSTGTGMPPAWSAPTEITVTADFDDTDILAWPGGALEIVPTPPAGYLISPKMIVVQADFSAGAYSAVDPDAFIVVQYAGGFEWSDYLANVMGGVTYVDTFLDGTDKSVWFSRYTDIDSPVMGYGPLVYVQTNRTYANAALQLKLDNGMTGNLMMGNGGNHMTVTTTYALVPVP